MNRASSFSGDIGGGSGRRMPERKESRMPRGMSGRHKKFETGRFAKGKTAMPTAKTEHKSKPTRPPKTKKRGDVEA
jgi:hypothetical protein